ncbi:hypothetical protein [Halocynthiibacter sp.]|uniref:hypothetical protein n=1 Tax=Halocynthiibacter sp. TaxID=1979210 RepID=UPI003C364177
MTKIRPQIWGYVLLVGSAVMGMSTPVYSNSTKVDVCQKVGEVFVQHLGANENIALALTTMRIVGSVDEAERAAEVFEMVSENTSLLVSNLEKY